MSTHVFQIDTMNFVAGLFWQPVAAELEAEQNREIRTLAKELSCDLFVLRRTTTPCVGLIAAQDDIRAGVMSAAAIISKSLEVDQNIQNFIFSCRLPDGNWIYVAQRDGIILPDGDQCFDREELARARFDQDFGLGDWAGIFAPDDWQIVNSQPANFEDLIPGDKEGRRELHQWWRLNPVDNTASYVSIGIKIVAGLALLGILYGGFTYYQKMEQERQAQRAIERAKQEAAMAPPAPTAPPTPSKPQPKPWASLPLASTMYHECITALEKIRLFHAGWDFKAVTCQGGQLSLNWVARDEASAQHLRALEPRAVITLDGRQANLTIPLMILPSRQEEAILPAQERLNAMREAVRALDAQLNLAPGTERSSSGSSRVVAPTENYQEINVTVANIYLVNDVLRALDGPGFRARALLGTFENGTLMWRIEGVQYVR